MVLLAFVSISSASTILFENYTTSLKTYVQGFPKYVRTGVTGKSLGESIYITFIPMEIPIFDIAVKLPTRPMYPMLAKGLLFSSLES